MNDQLTLGEALKDEGIATVTRNEAVDYKEAFRSVALAFDDGMLFTSEDITLEVGQPPNHPSSVGALMNGLARRGEIELVMYRKARRANQHASVIGVWRRMGELD